MKTSSYRMNEIMDELEGELTRTNKIEVLIVGILVAVVIVSISLILFMV